VSFLPATRAVFIRRRTRGGTGPATGGRPAFGDRVRGIVLSFAMTSPLIPAHQK
jgi:hypothetical protein